MSAASAELALTRKMPLYTLRHREIGNRFWE